ncbi:AAA family ATPase [Lacinutrix sp. MEBiC02595]
MQENLKFINKDLVDQAIKQIDLESIPQNRKARDYAVVINNVNYPFKLTITEAAKIAKINITSNDFSSVEANRKGFTELTGYPIINLTEGQELTFKNLRELVDSVNSDLGNFCNNFQKKKKELFSKKRMNSPNKLFVLWDNDRDWSINEGGGTELQYHLFFRNNTVGYGLGFNTQYVPFANEFTTVDYMKPFANSFLAQKEVQQELYNGSFGFINGNISDLENLVNDNYILVGKQIEVSQENDAFNLDNTFYSEMLNDIKGLLFESYIKIVEERNQHLNFSASMQNHIELLNHKKQIILQGPPGTGKTRLAKLIAQEMTNSPEEKKDNKNLFSDKYIVSKLEKVEVVDSATDITKYKIDEVEKERCKISLLSTGATYNVSYNGIRKAIEDKLWVKGKQKGGFDPYHAAIGKYLVENSETIQHNQTNTTDYKVIQFHPSYTYEDFVRGITVENNEAGKIEYKTKNRVLGEYAALALKNYNDFHKDETTYSNEVLLDDYFNQFVDEINENIENDEGFYKLTKSVGIVLSEDDAFRYKSQAQGWNQNGNRMLFKDIKQAFLDGNTERQDLKHNENLSGLAKHHASYFVRVLNLFQQFLEDKKLTFDNKEIQKEPLKNYVLIIDEINRANLSSVLGELIYALEYRGESVDSMYALNGNRSITLPPNLFIIGTMNTADRSVGQIDYAIRRRFAFVDVLPKVLSENDLNANKKEEDSKLFFKEDVFLKVKELFTNENDENSDHLSEEFEAKDVQLGHSYFIYTENNFKYNLDYEIKPILREYVTDGILKSSALTVIEDL